MKIKKIKYQVGQIVKNKRNDLIRRITKVVGNSIFWISKNGKRKGKCEKSKLTEWINGKDNKPIW